MKNKVKKIISYAAFAVYALAMALLLFKRAAMPYHSINLVPFRTIAEYFGFLSNGSGMNRLAVINLGGNVGLFIPLGLFLAITWEKLRRFLPHLLATAVIIIVVELIQYITLRGTADIDDLILNIIGSAIGFILYTVYEKIKNHIIKKKSEK